ncbi:hypothetical protein [Streptomyces sp. NPDC050428]|uniref:hypothetical protein n=1 Tax=Streptomyces sp. NPDC050428 TaxID=3155757 RepID=UPI00341DA88A
MTSHPHLLADSAKVPKGGSLPLTGMWQPMARQPLSPRRAYDTEFVDGVSQSFAAQHKVTVWLAKQLMPAMLADLAVTGDWFAAPEKGLVAVRSFSGQSLCHGLIMDRDAGKVLRYESRHNDSGCLRPAPEPPPAGADLWLGHPGDREISVASGEGWRVLLRTASRQRIRLTQSAIWNFTRFNSGHGSTPQTLTHDYLAAADRIDKLSSSVPKSLGTHEVADDTDEQRRLVWQIVVTRPWSVARSVRVQRPLSAG